MISNWYKILNSAQKVISFAMGVLRLLPFIPKKDSTPKVEEKTKEGKE